LVMMKKVLALMLVLGMTSLANATVVDVVTVGMGDQGHAGTSTDPLYPSETIEIAIVLNFNPYDPVGSTYPSYDGYITDATGVDLHVTGPGSLEVPGLYDKNSNRIGDDLKHHSEFSVWSQSGNNGATPAEYVPLIVDNAIAKMSGGVLEGVVKGNEDGGAGAGVLMWNLFIHCEEYGPVTVDLTLQDINSRYANYSNMGGTDAYPPDSWTPLLESDLGDLVIHQIPEPMTIALLGLGGLFLRRRR
jgi:hypothetical protein